LILREYNTVAWRVYNIKIALPFDLDIRAIGWRVYAYTRSTNYSIFSVYEPSFAYTTSFLSPADRSYRRLFSAVFHFPNFLECAGRHGIAGRSAQKQQHRSVSHCSFSFIVKVRFPDISQYASIKSSGIFVYCV